MSHTTLVTRRGALSAGALLTLGLPGCAAPGTQDVPASPESPNAEPEPQLDPGELDGNVFDRLVAAGPVADSFQINECAWAQRVVRDGTLYVAGPLDSPLFGAPEEDGVVRGFEAGVAKLLANYVLGDPAACDISRVGPASRADALRSGSARAIIDSVAANDETEAQYDFAGPYLTLAHGLLVPRENTSLNVWPDLEYVRVGALAASASREALATEVPAAEVVEFEATEEALEALAAGEVDVFVDATRSLLDLMIAEPEAYRLPDEFGPQTPYGIAMPQGLDGAPFVNRFLTELCDSGVWDDLWEVCLSDRVDVFTPYDPPTVSLGV